MLLALLGVAALAVISLSQGISHLQPLPFTIDINGHDITGPLEQARQQSGARLMLAAGAVLLAMVLLIVLPVALLVALGLLMGVVLMVVLVSVGAPLLSVVLLLAVLLSPLWLLVWLLRWLLR
jgi:hypothetical protein